MQTSEPQANGYVMAQPPQLQGTPAGEFIGEVLRGLTHKQNNFLAVIQGFSSLILMTDGLDASVKENLEQIKEATTGSKVLAERILSVSGSVRVNLQPVALQESLSLMEGALRAPGQKFGVPVQLTVAPDVPPVLADAGRLKDVLVELILNACEAVAGTGKPGGVALDVLAPGRVPESRPGCVDIFVRNTGMTITPEKLRELFKPFKTTKDSKHCGIGLTIAAMLLSQMNATLGAKCENDTTIFWISLPVAA